MQFKLNWLVLAAGLAGSLIMCVPDFCHTHEHGTGCAITIINPTHSSVWLTTSACAGEMPKEKSLRHSGAQHVGPYETQTFMLLDQPKQEFYVYTRRAQSNDLYEKHYKVQQKYCSEFDGDNRLSVCDLEKGHDAFEHFAIVDVTLPTTGS